MAERLVPMSEEMVDRAKRVLYLTEAVQNVIKELTKEIAKNHKDVVQLWNDVEIEAGKRGFPKGEGEIYIFDYITETFRITTKK